MYLYINTSRLNEFDVFLLAEKRIVARHSQKGDYKISETLLKAIAQLIKKQKISPSKIKGIIVITGPGAFTSLRIAVAIANTLAFSWNIPVVGLVNNKNLTEQQLITLGLSKIKTARKGNFTLPFYDREPNITKAKS